MDFASIIKEAPAEFTRAVFDLIHLNGLQQGGSFRFDDAGLVGRLNARPVNREPITTEMLAAWKPHFEKVFLELPDGRWVLNPNIFSVNNPLDESA